MLLPLQGRLIGPSLWEGTLHPGTQGQGNIWDLPSQGFPGYTCIDHPEGKINSWVGRTPTDLAGIRTRTGGFVVRIASHYTTEARMRVWNRERENEREKRMKEGDT